MAIAVGIVIRAFFMFASFSTLYTQRFLVWDGNNGVKKSRDIAWV